MLYLKIYNAFSYESQNYTKIIDFEDKQTFC